MNAGYHADAWSVMSEYAHSFQGNSLRGGAEYRAGAVDLRGGACVQLVGGEYTQERVRLEDPVGVARDWTRFGFRRLHVVDLDAATGRGSNGGLVREILRDISAHVQVGGGVRHSAQVEELLADGAGAVVVGTRALEDADWLERVATAWPNEVLVAAERRGSRQPDDERRAVTHAGAVRSDGSTMPNSSR